jgi:hypothetical protein
MKKYLALIGLVALAMGCAISEYPVITDNNGTGDFVVNTNGKALIMEDYYYRTILCWTDGDCEEIFSMIDQKFDGTAKITSYANVTSLYGPIYFFDNQYCNPDWTGCAVMTSNDSKNGIFFDEYTTNPQCQGYRSFSTVLAYNVRMAECGRSLVANAGMDAVGTWANAAVMVPDGYQFTVNRGNTEIVGIDDLGNRFPVGIYGSASTTLVPGKGFKARYSPNMAPTVHNVLRLSDQYGVSQWEVTFLGHSLTFDATPYTENVLRKLREY